MIAGNWKMNNTKAYASEFIDKLEAWFEFDEIGRFGARAIQKEAFEVVVAPTFVALDAVTSARNSDLIKVAAQNAYYQPKGAFTGEISLPMLEELGCNYVILGHSERRHIFGESDELLQKKLIATLESDILPIFCIGETLEERDSGDMQKVLRRQILSATESLTSDIISDMVVFAYEPVWAIGTGKAASDKDANDACAMVRSILEERFGAKASDSVRVLYGGSVNVDNCSELLTQDNIDGLLIGGASLTIESFTKIIGKTIPGSFRDK